MQVCQRWLLCCLVVLGCMRASAQYKASAGQAMVEVIRNEQKILYNLIRSMSFSGKNQTTYAYLQYAQRVVHSRTDSLVDTLLRTNRYGEKERTFLLKRLHNMLVDYKTLYHTNTANVRILDDLIRSFFIIITHTDTAIDWKQLVDQNAVEGKKILLSLFFYKYPLQKFKNHIVLHYTHKYPKEGLALCHRFGTANFDTIFTYVLRKEPQVIFDDLLSPRGVLRRWYAKRENPYLRILFALRTMHKASFYFPFYADLLLKKLSIRDIRMTVNTPPVYFRLLVKTHIRHLKEIGRADTPANYAVLFDYMHKVCDRYIVTVTNNLHNASDQARFRCLHGFSAPDLYYVMICRNDHLYTSGFLYIYRVFLKLLGNKNGFVFLKELSFDAYRKFIKTLAVYGHLYGKNKNDFLNTMSAQERTTLMRVFVNSISVDRALFLEDAIDVANTLTGIYNQPMLALLSMEIDQTRKKYQSLNERRGVLVYAILQKLVGASMKVREQETDYGEQLDLYRNENINVLDLRPFVKDKKRIIEQVFFYGDNDSERSFFHLLYTFSNKKHWRVRYLPDWVVIESKGGFPITIYANRPFAETNQGYLAAQQRLKKYFLHNNIIPIVVMHRGHSYFVLNTIQNLSPHVRMVLLGSCGSYSLMSRILMLSPNAHLVSTRQIGKTAINSQLFFLVNEQLRTNGVIEWTDFWETLRNKIAKGKMKLYFEDYIPPNKNLGAIFMKYYYHSMSKIY